MPARENADNTNHAQKILQQLKNDFLADLPDRYTLIEDLVLSLQKSDSIEQVFDELYRVVHSLKGSAGTFGVRIITTICHHLEDHLNIIDNNLSNISDEFINTCLAYVDLVKQAYSLTMSNETSQLEIENNLATLRDKALNNRFSVLIVTGSTYMNMMCQDSLKGLPVQLTTVDDGISALERLTHEKYDFVIIGNEISALNGTAVTCALRVSKSVNHNTSVIMITTKDKSEFIELLAPDYIIKKDQQLSTNLTNAAQQIVATQGQPRANTRAL